MDDSRQAGGFGALWFSGSIREGEKTTPAINCQRNVPLQSCCAWVTPEGGEADVESSAGANTAEMGKQALSHSFQPILVLALMLLCGCRAGPGVNESLLGQAESVCQGMRQSSQLPLLCTLTLLFAGMKLL